MKQVIKIHIERPLSGNEESIIKQIHPLKLNEMLNDQREAIRGLLKEEGILPEHIVSITSSFVDGGEENES